MRLVLVLLCSVLVAAPAVAFGSDFDHPASNDPSQQFGATNPQRTDTPNDPNYDRAEPDDQDAVPRDGRPAVQGSTNLFDERFDLFGFPSFRSRTTAIYKDGPNAGKPQISGFNAAGAWKITRGVPEVSVAILDTGINWDNGGLRDKVALNREELPLPRPLDPAAKLGGYDLNGNGALDVDDYKDDPRVGKPAPTGQDLIRAFSDGKDDGVNGYVDDIAGWDFFDDDNDPQDASSYFAASNHGSGRTGEAVERGNDGAGEIGVCPKCQFVPIRIWDTFVSDQNNFGMGIVYAVDNGVEVIEGADGGLYHSAFVEAATRYAYEKGVAQLYSGDDLNTGNHNFPAAYTHTQLVEGTVADVKGLGMDLPSDERDPGIRGGLARIFNSVPGLSTTAPLQTYFRGANTTQFGGKSSISMEGTTGSANTGKAAGAAALVIAAGREAGVRLSADETRELLEQTAEDVTPGNTVGTGNPDPSQPGFDTHFGYGRVNLGEAVRAASTGDGAGSIMPPEASIASPDWYAPVTGATVGIKGLAQDRRHPDTDFTWTLEYGVGLAPTSFTKVREGKSRDAVTDFGTIPLDQVRAQLAARNTFQDRDDPAGPTLDKTDPRLDPYQGQFTVRVRVTSGKVAAAGQPKVILGEDRKVLTALDPKQQGLRDGFPKRLGAGGEAPLRYEDLDGDNVQEMVLPTEDGLVHAFRPDGSELPGWPVRTERQYSSTRHLESPALKALTPPLEPPRAATVADVTGDGRPEVLTAAGERIYVWDAKGKLLPGFPVNPDPERANCAPSKQRKADKRVAADPNDDLAGRHPKCGFLASPAVGRLEGKSGPLSIVVPGLDGQLRAYHADGKPTPNFPRQLIDPTESAEKKVVSESINNPAIGDLDGDGFDDVVVASNEVYGSTGGGNDVSFAGALSAAGTTSRVYAVSGKTGAFLPGWPIKLGGIIQDVLPLIGPGHDASLVKIGGVQQVVVSTTGSTTLGVYDAKGVRTREINQSAGPDEGAINLFESAVVGDVDGDAGPDVVKYQLDLGQAANLLLVGQNFPYSHRIGAFDARTGTAKPGFPVVTDDYQFLSSSTVAKVAPGTANQVLAPTALGLLHAYDGVTGRDAPGFPKVTGGWLFSPAALSDDGRLAGITREGYLFEWKAPDGTPACQGAGQWPSFRHDPQSTGNYDADGTAPGAPERLSIQAVGGETVRLHFFSPGDDRRCGTPKRYVADVDGVPLDLGPPAAAGKEIVRDFRLPAGARQITIRAEDEVGNLGAPAALLRSGPGAPFVPVRSTEIADPAPRSGQAPIVSVPPATPTVPKVAPAKLTAKLGLARAQVLRSSRRLDVLAPITRLASGRVRVAFRAAGRTTRFTAPVSSADGRIRFRKRIPAAQARKGTGIVTLSYPGDADTRSQVVRLRAARNPANLSVARPTVDGGRLQMSGTLSRRARGVVRVQLQYATAAGITQTVERRARISGGRFKLDELLAGPLRSAIAGRSGTLHAYVLFTGYERGRVRGELRSYQVLGSR